MPGRAPGLHLSPKGRAQAERVAERLAVLDPRPVAVYCSPLERTRETAAPIARALGLRVRADAGLLETDIGKWAGTSLARARRRREWGAVQSRPSTFRFPGGETFAELSARVTDAIWRLAAAHKGKTFVVVSHADPIRAAVAAAAGIPLDLFQRLMVSTASVSAIAYHEESVSVVCVNSSADSLVAR